MEKHVESSKGPTRWLKILQQKIERLTLNPPRFNGRIPPELQEFILEKVDDDATLWRCRLVCSYWNQIASSLLAKRQLDNRIKWNPRLSNIFLSPCVISQSKRWNISYSSFKASLPLRYLDDESSNPLPTNSLTISGKSGTWNGENLDKKFMPSAKGPSWKQPDVEKLFTKCGIFITTFSLHNLEITELEISQILEKLPNLVLLSFSFLEPQSPRKRHKEELELEEWKVNPVKLCPNLTHVKLKYCTPEPIFWLLKLCASMLISLDIEYCFGPIPPLRLSSFKELRELKVCVLYRAAFTEILSKFVVNDVPLLRNLSIIMYTEGIGAPVLTEEVLSFAHAFRDTLNYLYFDVHESDMLVKLLPRRSWGIFPLVTELEISNPGSKWVVTKLKKKLELNFPKLESLQFHSDCEWHHSRVKPEPWHPR